VEKLTLMLLLAEFSDATTSNLESYPLALAFGALFLFLFGPAVVVCAVLTFRERWARP
jgi:hypothetical protein